MLRRGPELTFFLYAISKMGRPQLRIFQVYRHFYPESRISIRQKTLKEEDFFCTGASGIRLIYYISYQKWGDLTFGFFQDSRQRRAWAAPGFIIGITQDPVLVASDFSRCSVES
tara:strand:+ start:1012 stop:1353 length:342 start_codon:yes stop_codon:yes gene_type:complete